ncbi:MAG: SDR family NAD(P)-dependent oxidoreductase, partial [Pseudorhodobacter sp.]|nr:SDR family NAD(P)-dependent oxidoreductase [Frankiaceae bacterium]
MTVTDTPMSILLTGPTGGLGRALLEPLARRHPAHLVLLGRARGPLQDAAEIARAAGARAVSIVEADLADLDDVARAGAALAALVKGGVPPLTSLVLNAGLQMTDRRHVSAQGLERTFAVNVAAQHLLLKASSAATAPGAHAVIVGSGTHFGDWHSYGMVPAPKWQDPELLARPDTAQDKT